MSGLKVPGAFDALFRQLTPLFLLLVLGVVLFEPVVPGGDWLRRTLGETIILRVCLCALGLYVLLLWGESLRLNAILSGVLRAFREHSSGGASGAAADAGADANGGSLPKARLEAARLLIAALGSDDPEIQATSRHNLQRLVGEDLGAEPGPWLQWVAERSQESS